MRGHCTQWLALAAMFVTLSGPAIAQAPWTADASTVALIHFDEPEGPTCFDSSPNANHATLSGATRVAGRFGNAVYLDGVDDFIQLARSASLDPLPTPQMTLEFWVKLARTGRNGICNKALISGSSCWPWAFMTFNSSELYGLVRGCNGGVSGPVLPLNEWRQVSLVYDATGATPVGKLYVDGSLVATNSNMETQTTNLAADVYIGALYHVSNPGNHLQDFFKGTIDEVRISNSARSFTCPSMTVPPAVIAYTGVGATGCEAGVSDVSLGSPASSPDCLPLTYTRMPSGNSFPVGTTTITWTGSDGVHAPITAQQTVTVIDDTPPVLVAPPSISIMGCPPVLIGDVELGAPIVEDNCDGETWTRSGVPSLNQFNEGTTEITYHAVDAHGNDSAITQLVTVVALPDSTPLTAYPVDPAADPSTQALWRMTQGSAGLLKEDSTPPLASAPLKVGTGESCASADCDPSAAPVFTDAQMVSCSTSVYFDNSGNLDPEWADGNIEVVPRSALWPTPKGLTIEAYVWPTNNGPGSACRREILTASSERMDLPIGGQYPTGQFPFGLRLDAANRLQGWVNYTGTQIQLCTSAAPLPYNQWSFVGMTYDGMKIRLYVNGQGVDSTAAPGCIQNRTGYFIIGAQKNVPNPNHWGPFGHSFQGYFDDVRVSSAVHPATGTPE